MTASNTYQEVYEVLSLMDKLTVMKIPEELIKLIKENRDTSFETKIDKKDIFNPENISKEAVDMLCWLDYKYCMNENKKKEIDTIRKDLFNKAEEEQKKKYNPKDLFINRTIDPVNKIEIESTKEELSLVEIKEKGFIQRIINKIMRFFKKD